MIHRVLGVLVVGMLGLSTAGAGTVRFTGGVSASFHEQGREMTVNVLGGLANTDTEAATGSLMLRVWANETPFTADGEVGGYAIADYPLDPLKPGASYRPFSRRLKVTPPPRGWYYLCVVVRQYTDEGWVMESSVPLPKPVLLGPAQRFTLTAPWTWQTHPAHGVMDIGVARISHTAGARTGSLQLTVLATQSPYVWNAGGRVIGQANLKPLDDGYTYTSLSQRAPYWAPPRGWYYVNLLLAEYSNGSYRLQAVIPATKASLFK